MKTPKKIELIAIEKLIPYAMNARTHSEEQVAQIAGSIREFGFTNPVLVDKDETIIAGHGRVLAARVLEMDFVPCIRLDHLTPAQVRAYVIADNKLALNAGWDESILKAEIDSLKTEGFEMELTGFSNEELDAILQSNDPESGLSEKYTHKIEAPIYTPKGDKPQISELVDSSKAEALIREIESAKLPKEIDQFLKTAAARHFAFNYEKIAEFYCHADKKTQQLMEDSALIIIDFNKALQNGYAKLREELVTTLESQLGSESEEEPQDE